MMPKTKAWITFRVRNYACQPLVSTQLRSTDDGKVFIWCSPWPKTDLREVILSRHIVCTTACMIQRFSMALQSLMPRINTTCRFLREKLGPFKLIMCHDCHFASSSAAP
mmetsp:Transcript_43144/g.76039  ORF Transcript_43144/g.76039 Transcript_43144/m.76039 type:complete len:109 (-) Transcript_43144:75-401(-)